MKILTLVAIHREVIATLNSIGYADTCRDDLPVMDCIDMVAQVACSGNVI